VNIFITKILVQMQLKYYLQVKVQSSERVDFLSVRRYARVASMVYAMALYLLSICMERPNCCQYPALFATQFCLSVTHSK